MLSFQILQRATAGESTTYSAAVVEYHPDRNENDEHRVENNLKNYVTYILDFKSQPLDVMVFPESTLNSYATAVVIPETIEACQQSEGIINRLSCAAKTSSTYLVVNLTTKRNCTVDKEESEDDRPCAEDDWNYYNTNVVFDRNGQIISM